MTTICMQADHTDSQVNISQVIPTVQGKKWTPKVWQSLGVGPECFQLEVGNSFPAIALIDL